MKCAISDRTVTCDLKKDRHVYLICRDPSEPDRKLFVPEGTVLDQVKSVFQSIRIPPKLLDALLAHMKAGHATENQFHRDAIEGLRRESDKVHGRLAVLLDLRLDRRITQDEYKLIAFVFSNLRLRGKKLEFSLRSPFDLMVNRATYTSWLGN